MAGKIPFFVTGANAKIKVNGLTMAMATDVSYSIKVKHQAPHVLGVFENFTLEPLSYEVTGTFTVIRYTSGFKSFATTAAGVQSQAATGEGFLAQASPFLNNAANAINTSYAGWTNPVDASDEFGNGVGGWGPKTSQDTLVGALTGGSFGGQALANQSLDPSKLHAPAMFDIEIHQVAKKDGQDYSGILARIRNARIVAADFKLTRKSLAMQTFTFQACYVDEDGFNAGESGVGQVLI